MIMDKFSLKGKAALITGAGQGLGRAFAQGFAEAGADILVADINDDTAGRAAEELDRLGVKTGSIKIDVADPADLVRAVAMAVELFGRLDIMFNNAGIGQWLEAEKLPIADWKTMMDINLNSVFYGCQAAFGQMQRQGGGSIINTASMSAHIVNHPQCQAGYNTAKAGVKHMTKSLAVEWARHNIRVNSLSPGYMNGPMAGGHFLNPEIGPIWRAGIPMGRPGEPEEPDRGRPSPRFRCGQLHDRDRHHHRRRLHLYVVDDKQLFDTGIVPIARKRAWE